MDQLVEQIDSKTGRKIYHYIGSDGVKGIIVSRKQHLIDLKEQGKLLNLNVEEISFKRAVPNSRQLYDRNGKNENQIEDILKEFLLAAKDFFKSCLTKLRKKIS